MNPKRYKEKSPHILPTEDIVIFLQSMFLRGSLLFLRLSERMFVIFPYIRVGEALVILNELLVNILINLMILHQR